MWPKRMLEGLENMKDWHSLRREDGACLAAPRADLRVMSCAAWKPPDEPRCQTVTVQATCHSLPRCSTCLRNIRRCTKRKDLTSNNTQLRYACEIHTGVRTKTHNADHSHGTKQTHNSHRGHRLHLKQAPTILSLLFSSSSQFLLPHKCPHFCSHIFWRAEPCERQSPPPQADPDVNHTVHGMPLCEWQVMQMHISKRQVGAAQHCWQNNVDRRAGDPHAAFIKQDKDMEQNEQGAVQQCTQTQHSFTHFQPAMFNK